MKGFIFFGLNESRCVKVGGNPIYLFISLYFGSFILNVSSTKDKNKNKIKEDSRSEKKEEKMCTVVYQTSRSGHSI